MRDRLMSLTTELGMDPVIPPKSNRKEQLGRDAR